MPIRFRIGYRRTDIECECRFGAAVTDRVQQLGHLLRRCTEPGGQILERRLVMHGHARKDDGPGRFDLLHELLETTQMIDQEMANAMFLLRRSCRVPNAGRNHEVLRSIGTDRIGDRHFRQRRAVEVTNSCVDQQFQNGRMGIRFDRIQHATRKAAKEVLCSLPEDVWENAIDRVLRSPGAQQACYVREFGQTFHTSIG